MFANKSIDKSTPIPLYYQLKQLIAKMIEDGELMPGDLIPTEQEFNEMFEISRTTTRQALSELVREGHLYRVKGKGTFVAKQKLSQDFMQRLEPFNTQISRLNRTPSTKVLCFEKRKAGPVEAKLFGIKAGEPLLYLERLRYADETPIVMVKTFLPSELEAILQVDIANVGLYQYLKKTKTFQVVRVTREVEAILSSPAEEKLLSIPPRTAIQFTTTMGYNQDYRLIEYSLAYYRGDMNKFNIELVVES